MTALDSAVAATPERRRPTGAIWVAVVATAEVLAVVANVGAPLQPLLAIVFVLTCPGFLILDLRQPPELSARVVLGIGASLAVNLVIFTLGVVADISWIAPALALLLLGIALMPKDRIRAGLQRMPRFAEGASGTSQRDSVEPNTTEPAAEPAAPVSDPRAAPAAEASEARDAPDDPAVASAEEGSAAEEGPAPRTTTVPARADKPDAGDSDLIDLNTASVAELSTLPGIGTEIATRIVVYRYSAGGLNTEEDLLNVAGVGPATFAKLRNRVVVKTPSTPSEADEAQ